MKVVTDGTTHGTRVLDDDGQLVKNVVAVRRRGRKTYVTIRHKDLAVEGADGDFTVTLAEALRIEESA